MVRRVRQRVCGLREQAREHDGEADGAEHRHERSERHQLRHVQLVAPPLDHVVGGARAPRLALCVPHAVVVRALDEAGHLVVDEGDRAGVEEVVDQPHDLARHDVPLSVAAFSVAESKLEVLEGEEEALDRQLVRRLESTRPKGLGQSEERRHRRGELDESRQLKLGGAERERTFERDDVAPHRRGEVHFDQELEEELARLRRDRLQQRLRCGIAERPRGRRAQSPRERTRLRLLGGSGRLVGRRRIEELCEDRLVVLRLRRAQLLLPRRGVLAPPAHRLRHPRVQPRPNLGPVAAGKEGAVRLDAARGAHPPVAVDQVARVGRVSLQHVGAEQGVEVDDSERLEARDEGLDTEPEPPVLREGQLDGEHRDVLQQLARHLARAVHSGPGPDCTRRHACRGAVVRLRPRAQLPGSERGAGRVGARARVGGARSGLRRVEARSLLGQRLKRVVVLAHHAGYVVECLGGERLVQKGQQGDIAPVDNLAAPIAVPRRVQALEDHALPEECEWVEGGHVEGALLHGQHRAQQVGLVDVDGRGEGGALKGGAPPQRHPGEAAGREELQGPRRVSEGGGEGPAREGAKHSRHRRPDRAHQGAVPVVDHLGHAVVEVAAARCGAGDRTPHHQLVRRRRELERAHPHAGRSFKEAARVGGEGRPLQRGEPGGVEAEQQRGLEAECTHAELERIRVLERGTLRAAVLEALRSVVARPPLGAGGGVGAGVLGGPAAAAVEARRGAVDEDRARVGRLVEPHACHADEVHLLESDRHGGGVLVDQPDRQVAERVEPLEARRLEA
mmetsp:Transcript_9011/g.28974  ORF Transcript_9011/g.28974 Transcript_9011/m.28974 type:complete len:791 (-) Transcript_9011:137-2509(-)